MPTRRGVDRRPSGVRRSLAIAVVAVALIAGCTDGDGGGSGASSTTRPELVGDLYRGRPVQGAPHPLGMKWDWSRFDRFVPYLRELSGGATFFELVWCKVERSPGQRSWKEPDAVVTAAAELGYEVYLKIRIGSCWATGGRGGRARGAKTASAMPVDMATYEDFVRAVVERYAARGVRTYAIENEVNAENFWADEPADFERLTAAAARVIREVDAGARVFDGGISSTAYGVAMARSLLDDGRPQEALAVYQRYYDRRFEVRTRDFPPVATVEELEQALQGEQAVRNLEFLASTTRLVREGVVTGYQLHFYEAWDNVATLIGYLRDVLPPDVPVEAWEVGMFWPGSPPDDQTQAAETAKVVATMLGGGIQRVIWLPLSYDPGGRRPEEIRFGLLDDAGTVREAGQAFRDLAAAAAGGATVRPVTSPRLAGIGLGTTTGSTLVVWSEGEVTLPGPAGPGARAALMGGQPLDWGANGIRLGPQPVIVRVAADLESALRLLS